MKEYSLEWFKYLWSKDIVHDLENGWKITGIRPIKIIRNELGETIRLETLIKWEDLNRIQIRVEKYFEHVQNSETGILEITKEALEDAKFDIAKYLINQLKSVDEETMKLTKEDVDEIIEKQKEKYNEKSS